jgi:tetratricopeptide (TPR) repeat protein
MVPTRMNRVVLLGLFVSGLALTGCTDRMLYEGQLAYEDKKYDVAEQKVTEVLAEDDTDAKALYYLGKIRLAQGRPAEAIVPLQKALSLVEDEPESEEVLDALAEAYLQQKQYDTLANLLQHAVNENGKMPDYLRQAKYLGKMGDADGALLAYRKAIRFGGPKDDTGYLALADYFESIGKTDQAIIAVRKALYISPGNMRTAERLRKYGIVPGPAATLRPSNDEFTLEQVNK